MPLTTVMGNWLGWLTPGLLFSAGVFVFLLGGTTRLVRASRVPTWPAFRWMHATPSR